MSDTIPPTLGNLASLQTLRLYNNQLRGEILAQLANLNPHLITLDLSYNRLSATDSALLTFLNAQQPGWAARQTIAPANVQASVQSPTSVALSWTPIAYTADGGYYDVLAALQPGGPYTSVGKTMGQFRKHEASGQAVWSLYCGFRSADENRSTERDKVPLGSIDSIAWLPIPHIGCSARSARHSRSPEWPYRSWLASYLPSLALDAGGNPRIAAAHTISGWTKRQTILLLVFGSTKRKVMVCVLSWFWDEAPDR